MTRPLTDSLAARIRQDILIGPIGPNALSLAARGIPIALTPTEARAIAGIAGVTYSEWLADQTARIADAVMGCQIEYGRDVTADQIAEAVVGLLGA